MKNRAKGDVTGINPYEGEWVDGNFVLTRQLSRSDMVSPHVKPSFIVYLRDGKRVLLSWSPKGGRRQYHIKEVEPLAPALTADGSWSARIEWILKVVRMRGPKWYKTIEAINKGMVRWFQDKTS